MSMFKHGQVVLGGIAHGITLNTKIAGAKGQLYAGLIRQTISAGQRICEWEKELALTENALAEGGYEGLVEMETNLNTGTLPVPAKAHGQQQPTVTGNDLMAEMKAARQDTKDLKSNMVTKKDLANQRAYMDANFQRKKGRPKKNTK